MFDYNPITPWRGSPNLPGLPREGDDPFRAFRRDLDRLFDSYFSAGRLPSYASDGLVPKIDVEEHDKEVEVTADLPGVDEKDVEIRVSGDLLSIRGEKKVEREDRDGGRYLSERAYGAFERSIRLPFEVGDGDADARFDKGVLTIRFPKPKGAESRSKRIEVKAA